MQPVEADDPNVPRDSMISFAAVVPTSLGRIDLINCMSASTPGLIPAKILTHGMLMKRPGT